MREFVDGCGQPGSEGQTIASKGRALTKQYMPHREPPYVEGIMGDLAQILMVIRAFSDLSGAMESVRSSADTDDKATIEATLQLDDTFKTEIAQSDVTIYVVPPGAIFDEERMGSGF